MRLLCPSLPISQPQAGDGSSTSPIRRGQAWSGLDGMSHSLLFIRVTNWDASPHLPLGWAVGSQAEEHLNCRWAASCTYQGRTAAHFLAKKSHKRGQKSLITCCSSAQQVSATIHPRSLQTSVKTTFLEAPDLKKYIA